MCESKAGKEGRWANIQKKNNNKKKKKKKKKPRSCSKS